MKPRTLLVILALLFSAGAGQSVFAAESAYSFGTLFAEGYGNANFQKIISDALNSISRDEGTTIELKWFTNEEEFMAAVAKGELDIVYPSKHDVLPLLIEKYGYKAFMSPVMFAGKNDSQNPLCIFSNKKRKIEKIEDLRGLRLASYYTAEGYIFLRKMLGEKPEEFFSEIIPNRKGQDALSSVVSGAADSAFVMRSNLMAMRKTRTTDAGKIDTIACVRDFYDLPFLHGDKIPDSLLKKIQALLENADTEDIFKPFRSMIISFKLKFIPVTPERYEHMLAVYTEAKEKGWMDDYRKWLATAEK